MAIEDRPVWNYSEAGSGRPLVLLHGIGMSHAAWSAVIPYLRPVRRVIAFDTAGFGLTPPLPEGTLPTIANLVHALTMSLGKLGIDLPVDIAGNSLGGSMAIEAARRGIARSVVAISPPGLWKSEPPVHVKYVFRGLRFGATRAPRILKAIMRVPALRELALAVPISVRSRHMPVEDARGAVDDLAQGSAFEETFENTRAPLVLNGITVPITVVFGTRDWILTRSARDRNGLPAQTRWIEKPGWGHVPLWVDPVSVAQLILDATT